MGRKRGRDPLLIAVLAELGAGKISEDFVRAENGRDHVHGITDGRLIVVNPMYEVVDTVLHECCHRARPDLSELAVRRRTAKFMRGFTDGEIQAIYDQYQKVATKVKRRGRRSA